ncbi:App1 family protein [Myxococcaceae bacterium GXIMD 01537]
MFARFLTVALLLGASASLAGPAVLLMPGMGRGDGVTLQGRVLKEAPTAGSSVLSRNLRRLTAPNWKGARVELSFQGASAQVTSGHDGAFEVNLPPPAGGRFKPGLHEATAVLEGGAVSRARVEVVADATPLLVVSDFDDTVAVTKVTDKKALVVNALMRDSESQEVVPGMAAFYGCLRQPGTSAAFALVSGSPVQYVSRVSDFLARHRFPPFALYLRDLGPSTMSGYKQPAIRSLLRRFPQPVVLVGDSGEHDPEVYAQIREEFPGRVRAIYIRDAGGELRADRFKDMVLFKDAREAANHAAGAGLVDAACVSKAFAADGTP